MESGGPDRIERTVAADLWENTLSQIPSVFGRLVYLPSLRNAAAGKCEHQCLDDGGRQGLRKSHARAFAEWAIVQPGRTEG